ncbi:MAG: hypothetical protein LBN71_09525 [Tannerella sp.]|jgi:hypothetical protein|nr:hypothetical protein [Tannerella sp.]
MYVIFLIIHIFEPKILKIGEILGFYAGRKRGLMDISDGMKGGRHAQRHCGLDSEQRQRAQRHCEARSNPVPDNVFTLYGNKHLIDWIASLTLAMTLCEHLQYVDNMRYTKLVIIRFLQNSLLSLFPNSQLSIINYQLSIRK